MRTMTGLSSGNGIARRHRCLYWVPMIHGFVVMADVPFFRNGKLSRMVLKGNFADMSRSLQPVDHPEDLREDQADS
jgi:hypothetical protein